MNQQEIKALVTEFLDKLSLAYDRIEETRNDLHPVFLITAKDAHALIGNRGENLHALNYLLRKMVEKRFEGSEAEVPRFLIDVNHYHSRRIREIQNKAKMLAERVRVFKYDVEMSPANAYERMLVHATFSGDPDIETESAGEGKFRRVVIKSRANPAAGKEEAVLPEFS